MIAMVWSSTLYFSFRPSWSIITHHNMEDNQSLSLANFQTLWFILLPPLISPPLRSEWQVTVLEEEGRRRRSENIKLLPEQTSSHPNLERYLKYQLVVVRSQWLPKISLQITRVCEVFFKSFCTHDTFAVVLQWPGMPPVTNKKSTSPNTGLVLSRSQNCVSPHRGYA